MLRTRDRSRGGNGSGGGGTPSLPLVASMWGAFEADYVGNTTETVSQTFTVDTAANTIDIGISTFGAFGSYSSCRGTQVFFSSTGKLPAPLQPDTPYYISPTSGTNYNIYPIATDADRDTIPGFCGDDNIYVAQNYACQVNAVDLTDTGSGTHTIYTRQLISSYNDMVGNGYNAGPVSAGNQQSYFETDLDPDGKRYVRSGRIARDHTGGGSYDRHGKTFPIGPGAKKLEIRQRSEQKRFVWQSYVCEITPWVSRGNPKAPVVFSNINTTTNVFTFNSHRFTTNGRVVRVKPQPGGTLPSALAINTDYYVRSVSANTFALYPTSADAVADTNRISLGSQGTVGTVVWNTSGVGDYNRGAFMTELIEPGSGGGNILSPGMTHAGPTFSGIIGMTDVLTSGNIANLKTFLDDDPNGDGVAKIDLWIPSGGSPPVRSDTGLPLASGQYWVTRSPGSSTYGRLHESYATALAAVGVSSGSLSSAQCVKFSSAGTGSMLVNWDVSEGVSYGTGLAQGGSAGGRPLPFNKRIVVSFLVDYFPDSLPNKMLYSFVNGVPYQTFDSGTPKALPDVAVAGDAGTFLNSAASHVPFEGKVFGVFFGSSVSDDPTADIQQVEQYLMAKYM